MLCNIKKKYLKNKIYKGVNLIKHLHFRVTRKKSNNNIKIS